MVVGGQCHGPAALPPPGKTRYPLYRRLGGPQGHSGEVQKISPPPGFDSRTVQPIVSCYTDWAIPAPRCKIVLSEIKFLQWPRFVITIRAYTLTLSDPTSDLVRHYDFPVPLLCWKTSDTFLLCPLRCRSLSDAFPHVARTLANR